MANAYYYALYLAGDLKLNSQWTWNMFELRYRDAFDYTWITPKVATGLTYEWSAGNFVYGNVGYAWKNTGSGLLGDKMNIAVGFKHGFSRTTDVVRPPRYVANVSRIDVGSDFDFGSQARGP